MKANERRYKRVEYKQDVQLCTTGDLKLQAHSENISMGGLEIRCDQVTAHAMMPFDYQFDPESPLMLSLTIYLDDLETPLQVSCCILNTYRLAQDLFCFNLKFVLIEESDQQQLAVFINR